MAKKTPPPVSEYRLSSSWQLLRQAARLLWSDKPLFGWLTLLYGLLSGVLVGVPLQFNASAARKLAESGGISAFTSLITANNSSDTAGTVYEILITFVISLAFLYSFRRVIVHKQREPSQVRRALYQGMYPLIPAFLLCIVVIIQLIPFVLAAGLLSALASATGSIVLLIIGGLVLLAILIVTLRWITASIMALYVVTLPDMFPLAAWRTARNLVQGRRFVVLRKLLIMALAVIVVLLIFILPALYILPIAAAVLTFVLLALLLPFVLAYGFVLYRELLND